MTIAAGAMSGLRRLLDGLLLALVAVSLGVLLLGRVVPLTGHPTLVVAGPSMEPAIPMGSAVVLDPVASADLAVGDVVSLRSGPTAPSSPTASSGSPRQDGVSGSRPRATRMRPRTRR